MNSKEIKTTQKGITLISLIITIIILLILAGITIAQLIGNGLFEKTKKAKEKADLAQELENITLSEYKNEIDEHINGTRYNSQSTIIYPNGGTESEPSTISINQRIEIDNPYPGHTLYLGVQVYKDGLWGEPGWIYAYSLGTFGVKATQIQGDGVDKIVIQSGTCALKAGSEASGDGFGDNSEDIKSPIPFRLKIICLD